MDVQDRIRELMLVRGWSEYKLAKAADLPQSTISHMFKRNNAPTFNTLQAICGAFGITLSQFFVDDGEPVALTTAQRELLLLWGSLSPEQQQIVRDTMRQFGDD